LLIHLAGLAWLANRELRQLLGLLTYRDRVFRGDSPTGRELSIGSELAPFGFWIYDLGTKTARQVLPGAVIWGRWSRDRKKMALVVGHPSWEIWEVDIDPNRPTVESLGPGLNEQEYCWDVMTAIDDWDMDELEEVRATVSGRFAAFCNACLVQEDECVEGLDK